MSFVETQKSFVNTWECDENAHLNVQFYVSRFGDAAAHFFAGRDFGKVRARPRLVSRHVRYHRELHATDLTAVATAAARIRGLGRVGFALVHLLRDPTRGHLAATAVDIYEGDGTRLGEPVDIPEEAMPRGVAAGPAQEERSAAELAAAGYLTTDRSLVRPRHCDADGTMAASALVGRYSDAQGFAYEQAGIGRETLHAAGRGRVTVELKVTILAPIQAGTPITTYGGAIGVGRSTFSFRHVTTDAGTGRAVAVGEVTALVMDLKERRASPLDEDIRAKIEASLVDVQHSGA